MPAERINLQSPILWGMVALVFTGGVVGAAAVLVVGTSSGGPGRAAGAIGLVFTAPIALLAWSTLIIGVDHVRADIAAGVFVHVSGRKVTSVPLDEVGALTITPYKRLSTRRAATWHKLEAAGLPNVILYETISIAPVERLRSWLELAIAASAVRRVLATHVAGETEAFRAAPDLEALLAAAVPDEQRRHAALAALTRDRDPEIRTRASSVTRSRAP